MTVADLIERLSRMDPNLEVVVSQDGGNRGEYADCAWEGRATRVYPNSPLLLYLPPYDPAAKREVAVIGPAT